MEDRIDRRLPKETEDEWHSWQQTPGDVEDFVFYPYEDNCPSER